MTLTTVCPVPTGLSLLPTLTPAIWSCASPQLHLFWSQLQPKAIPNLAIYFKFTVPAFARLSARREQAFWDTRFPPVGVAHLLHQINASRILVCQSDPSTFGISPLNMQLGRLAVELVFKEGQEEAHQAVHSKQSQA